MPVIMGILTGIILALALLFLNVRPAPSAINRPSPTPTADQRQTPAPAPAPEITAMCYAVMPPNYFKNTEYICPACGEKTLYEKSVITDPEKAVIANFIENELPYCRSLARQISENSGVVLDESGFCMKCRTKGQAAQLGIVVKYPGRPDHRVWGVNAEDLLLVKEFLDGSKIHLPVSGTERPLTDYRIRLEELLGITVTL